jgi:DNA-binding CsgD family transcriptional regulator
VINRSGGDFSERDRLMLDLLRPHLAQAYRNAESVTRLGKVATQARRAIEESDLGAVSLVGKDRVLWSTGRAREWMAEYFGPWPRTDRLPENLRRWVERQVSLLWTDGGVPPPREPLVVERAEKRLVVRLVADPSDDPHLLLMEERHAPLAANALRPLGLTPREEEILLLIARGNTDKDVAALLYISPRTVMKHLQHVYDKLGVGSRTEAIARALQAEGYRRE